MASSPTVPASPFKSILNFRDVGQTINILTATPSLNENLLYRSARPDPAPSSEKSALATTYHIRTLLDLRSSTEHSAQAQKQASLSEPSAPLPASITTHAISINGSAFSRALLWKLSWASLGKLIYTHFASKNPADTISILAKEVMQPRGLLGLACDTLTYSTRELKQLFEILADREAYPVLAHCTQGKDRTGLVVLLVLLLCEVPAEAIQEDYMASERELQPEMEERVKEIESIQLGGEFARCHVDFVQGVKRFLEEGWGGVEGYLEDIGVNGKMRAEVRRIMTG